MRLFYFLASPGRTPGHRLLRKSPIRRNPDQGRPHGQQQSHRPARHPRHYPRHATNKSPFPAGDLCPHHCSKIALSSILSAYKLLKQRIPPICLPTNPSLIRASSLFPGPSSSVPIPETPGSLNRPPNPPRTHRRIPNRLANLPEYPQRPAP